MRYQPLPADFHAGRRQQFMSQMPPRAVAVIDTNAHLVRSRDTQMPFRPDSYFYYLTGIDQPEAVLVMSGNEEWLFIKETDDFIRLWDGERYTPEQAAGLSGVQNVQWTGELEACLAKVLPDGTAVYANYSQPEAPDGMYAPGARRARNLKRRGLKVLPARPILAMMRMVKQPAEIAQIRRAVSVTAAGFERARQVLAPGLFEYQLEAEFSHEFTRSGAQAFAYEPVVASGAGSCVLHYIRNDRQMQAGELVLVDVGAEYGWYASDVTRTWPVGGEFTPRQREVYDAVLEVEGAAIAMMQPGADIITIEREVCRLLTEQLIQLNVITRAQVDADDRLIRKYYPHAPHQIGLDTHDVGDYRRPFEANMVHTIEPGLYLPDEQIGVRLEDDILITEEGNENLTVSIPV